MEETPNTDTDEQTEANAPAGAPPAKKPAAKKPAAKKTAASKAPADEPSTEADEAADDGIGDLDPTAALKAARADAKACAAELGKPVSINLMLGELADGGIPIPPAPAARAAIGALTRAGLARKGNGMVALTPLGRAAASS